MDFRQQLAVTPLTKVTRVAMHLNGLKLESLTVYRRLASYRLDIKKVESSQGLQIINENVISLGRVIHLEFTKSLITDKKLYVKYKFGDLVDGPTQSTCGRDDICIGSEASFTACIDSNRSRATFQWFFGCRKNSTYCQVVQVSCG